MHKWILLRDCDTNTNYACKYFDENMTIGMLYEKMNRFFFDIKFKQIKKKDCELSNDDKIKDLCTKYNTCIIALYFTSSGIKDVNIFDKTDESFYIEKKYTCTREEYFERKDKRKLKNLCKCSVITNPVNKIVRCEYCADNNILAIVILTTAIL